MIVATALISIPAAIILNGVAFSFLWGWFIVPLGLSQIGIAHCLGISLIAHLITHQDQSSLMKKNTTEDTVISDITATLMRPVFAFLFGYIFTMFM